jgi:hypothetical protein
MMDFLIETKDKPNNDNGFYTCDEGVILLVADDTEKTTIKDLVDETYDPLVNRVRLSTGSVGESSWTSVGTSVSIPYSVPSFRMKDEVFADLPVFVTPPKVVKHRRNRHVFASCCPKKSKSPKNREKSAHRRRRNRAWNEMDFASFMGFAIFSKET